MMSFLIIVCFSMIAGGYIHEMNTITSKKQASDPMPKVYFSNLAIVIVCLVTVILIRLKV